MVEPVSSDNFGYVSGSDSAANTRGIDANSSVRISPDILEEMSIVTVRSSPFMSMVDSAVATLPATNMEFTNLEQWRHERISTATATSTAADTTIDIDDADPLVADCLLRNLDTDEIAKVTSIATNTVTVHRGFAGTAAAVAIGDKWLNMGPNGEDGQDAFESITRGDGFRTLYCEETGWAISATEWDMLTKMRGPAKWTQHMESLIFELTRSREAKHILGLPKKQLPAATAGGKTAYTMAGLRYLVGLHNQADMGGTMTYEGFCDAVEAFARLGNTDMLHCLSSRRFINKVRGWTQFQTPQRSATTDTRVGSEPKTVLCGDVTVTLQRSEFMEIGKHHNEACIYNLNDLYKKSFMGMSEHDNIQANGAHRRKFEARVTEGMGHKNPYGAGLIINA